MFFGSFFIDIFHTSSIIFSEHFFPKWRQPFAKGGDHSFPKGLSPLQDGETNRKGVRNMALKKGSLPPMTVPRLVAVGLAVLLGLWFVHWQWPSFPAYWLWIAGILWALITFIAAITQLAAFSTEMTLSQPSAGRYDRNYSSDDWGDKGRKQPRKASSGYV